MSEDLSTADELHHWRLENLNTSQTLSVARRRMKADEKLIQEQKEIIEYQRNRIRILEKKLWETK